MNALAPSMVPADLTTTLLSRQGRGDPFWRFAAAWAANPFPPSIEVIVAWAGGAIGADANGPPARVLQLPELRHCNIRCWMECGRTDAFSARACDRVHRPRAVVRPDDAVAEKPMLFMS